jgi:dTDP-4-dehydrorhamnose reductase
MRVLVVGAGGRLGRALLADWVQLEGPTAHDVIAGLGRDRIDVADQLATRRLIGDRAPDLVINCAARTDVDGCEADQVGAYAVNASAAGHVAEACTAVGAELLHLSTDYVHGGPPPLDDAGRPRGWRPSDPIAPMSVYGRTKAAGEKHVRDAGIRHWIVRTSWLHAVDGPSFVRAMLARAVTNQPLRAVADQHGSPTFVADLVASLRDLVHETPHGTYNRANSGCTTWHGLAEAAIAAAGLTVPVTPVTAADLGRRAARPPWSALDDMSPTSSNLTPLPRWQDGLERFIEAIRHRS